MKGLFNIQATEDIAIEIINIDWSNIGQALIAVAIIVIRKFDFFKLLI